MIVLIDKVQTLQKFSQNQNIEQTLSLCQSKNIIPIYCAPPSNYYHAGMNILYRNGQLDDNYDASCQCKFS